jgi:hypothetical protein
LDLHLPRPALSSQLRGPFWPCASACQSPGPTRSTERTPTVHASIWRRPRQAPGELPDTDRRSGCTVTRKQHPQRMSAGYVYLADVTGRGAGVAATGPAASPAGCQVAPTGRGWPRFVRTRSASRDKAGGAIWPDRWPPRRVYTTTLADLGFTHHDSTADYR